MLTKHCKRCNIIFPKSKTISLKNWPKRQYCSHQCRKNPLKQCIVCGTFFNVRGKRQLMSARWCSRTCRYSYPIIDITTRAYRSQPRLRYHLGIRVAKQRNLKWNISQEIYTSLVLQPCFYCSNKLGNVQNEMGVGLDRIINTLGYINDNVLPCCGICNQTRSNIFTVSETKAAIEAVLVFRESLIANKNIQITNRI